MPTHASRAALHPGGSDREIQALVQALLALAARLQAVRNGFAARLGLPGAAYTTLIAIAHLEAEGEPPGLSALGAYLRISPAFATMEVEQLQRLGLVRKERHGVDGRRVLLSLTPQGRARLAEQQPVQLQVNDDLFAGLTAQDVRRLSALLPRLVANADAALALLRAGPQRAPRRRPRPEPEATEA
ncbi:MarR family winged helix-turn-helix transcriptional regulator [Siccirubricoccus sp. KC 17139]|uniref:MarR family winged helix-turn-helix transcriptional regulator n=1 Tax=Siccirubricoccus soli TaxID=2899147 RepID=A0ABT1D0R9_9PROT|nr:MarR family winged helix-turn-helix transcriptional regulator [Siccirubricoccus soli]MCO6415505.1 MarR family winged helix-turn-helix transcriptional regulator [Siccirubricoccus soli]MCP2681637.1 MarR family winged helix-turn-helix transcriptional regulator [Siccirubricoccus soli]